MTTLRTFTNQGEASFCSSFLQAHGFDAVLLDEGSFAWNWSGGAIPIRLQVPEEQLAAAAECLRAFDSASTDTAADTDGTPDT